MKLRLGNLELEYPELQFRGPILSPLFKRLSDKRKRRERLRLSDGGTGGRRDSLLQDELAVAKFIKSLVDTEYQKEKDRQAGLRSDRDYQLRATTERRQQAEFQFQQMKEMADREKEFVNKWIELYHKAGEQDNLTLQRNLMDSFMDYKGKLSPEMKAVVEPIIKAGPFSKKAQQIAQFKKLNPEPRITATAEEPTILARQITQREHWKSQLSGIETGKVGHIRELIPIGEGLYVHTEGGGQLVDEETLNLKDQAKTAGVPYLKYLADGGAWGTSSKLITGGVERTVAPFKNLKGETTMREISQKPLPGNKELYNFMTQWAGWEELDDDEKTKRSASIVADVHRRLEAGESMIDISRELLKPRFGVNFVKVDQTPDPTQWYLPWTWLSDGAEKLRVTYGDLIDMQGFAVYYDPNMDRVFNANTGDDLGTYQDADAAMRRARSRGKSKTYQGTF